MFTNKQVLEDLQPSHWTRITPSQLMEFNQPDQGAKREQSQSRAHRAQAQGLFLAAYGIGWLKASTTAQMASKSATPAPEVEPKLEGTISQWPSPPPGFADFA